MCKTAQSEEPPAVHKYSMGFMSRWARSVLSEAFEIDAWSIEGDAKQVQQWTGTDAELMSWLDEHHGWSHESDLAVNYLPLLRRALSG
jgi:hypothetical protein